MLDSDHCQLLTMSTRKDFLSKYICCGQAGLLYNALLSPAFSSFQTLPQLTRCLIQDHFQASIQFHHPRSCSMVSKRYSRSVPFRHSLYMLTIMIGSARLNGYDAKASRPPCTTYHFGAMSTVEEDYKYSRLYPSLLSRPTHTVLESWRCGPYQE